MRRSSLALVIALLCASSSAQAAIARRGVAEGHSTATTTCATTAFSTAPVTGDTMVVVVSSFNGVTTFTAPTDGLNTYTQIGTTLASGSATSDVVLSVWRKENMTGGASFVVTGHVSQNGCTVIAWDLSGANTPTSYNADKTGTTATASANPASGSSTPAPAASSFFVGGMSNGGTETVTAGSGWQFETNSTQTNNSSFQDLFTEDLTAAGNVSSSAQSATFTATSDLWAAQVQSVAPTSGGVVCAPTLTLLGVGRCS